MKTTPPLKLGTLRRNAARSTAKRGHRLKWGEPYGRPAKPDLGFIYENYSQTGTCKCGAWVTIAQFPAPNGIAIGGAAVAVDCAAC